MNAPLEGIRVVDFSELLPGPFLTQSLVELGAEVIKIERPPKGDLVRITSPGLFQAVNRGKKSLSLNLKDETDRKKATDLINSSDILIEGYRPGVMGRLGLDYATLSSSHKKLIYLSISGFGQEGPLSQVPGHDLNYLAQAGITSLSGDLEKGPGHAFGLPVADLAGATYGLSVLMAALFQRERSGEGQYLDLSMTDCVAHWTNARRGPYHYNAVTELADQRRLALTRPAYGVYACKDGSITIAALEGHFWKSLVEAINLEQFSGPAYETLASRTKDCAAINSAIAGIFATMNSEDAMSLLLEHDVPVTRVLTLKEAAQSDHFRARDLLIETATGELCRFPIRMTGMEETSSDTPDLDEDNGL